MIDGARLQVDISLGDEDTDRKGLSDDKPVRCLVRLIVDVESRQCELIEVTSPCW